MPFGLNVVTLLDRAGYEIDVYLSEYSNNAYDGLFSDRVHFHFLDHNYMWPKEGKWSYWFLTTYFRCLSIFKLRGKYSHVFASGMAGITLGGILKSVNRKAKFIYMNDEFPLQEEMNIWVKSEIRNAQKADFVSTPDEARFPPLCKQIKGLDRKAHFPLPNTPLMDEAATIPEKDWHAHFGIPKDKKLFLMAGGLQGSLLIAELMSSVKNWPENSVLIIKGKHEVRGFKESLEHLNIPEKIIWSVETFDPDTLHSLIRYCAASICLYNGINDNLAAVGKSSGKLMRSVWLGKPVIVSKQDSFQFVEDLGLGKMVDQPEEIADAVRYILENEKTLQENCVKHYPSISFEQYWTAFSKAIMD